MNFNFKTKPYKHQLVALEKSYDKKNYAYFMEMGCGKSKVLIDNAVWLYEQGQIDTVVIVAPKGVYQNWQTSEIPAHMPTNIKHQIYLWNPNPNGQQALRLRDGITMRQELRILLVNVEGFATAKVRKYLELFTRNTDFLLAVDESTTIKNPQAKRTKALVSLGKDAKFKTILTGSPITKSPMDLYSQCLFMDKKLLNFDSYWSFQGRYAVTRTQKMGSHSFQQVVGFRNLEELKGKLNWFSYRVTKKEALDLPEKTYVTREVYVTEEQAKHYKAIKDVAMTILEDELVAAPEVMTQLLRLQQILSGYLISSEGNLIEFPTKRMSALESCIEEMTGKVIIWSRFVYDIERIERELKRLYGNQSTVTYYGKTSNEDRQKAIKSFQENDEVQFFVANPQTAGYGLTLTSASNVIYYANDFNLETRMQSEDRCHRIGQTNPVLYVDLVTKGTVDVHIVKVLQKKINLSAKTLGEQAREWLTLS